MSQADETKFDFFENIECGRGDPFAEHQGDQAGWIDGEEAAETFMEAESEFIEAGGEDEQAGRLGHVLGFAQSYADAHAAAWVEAFKRAVKIDVERQRDPCICPECAAKLDAAEKN